MRGRGDAAAVRSSSRCSPIFPAKPSVLLLLDLTSASPCLPHSANRMPRCPADRWPSTGSGRGWTPTATLPLPPPSPHLNPPAFVLSSRSQVAINGERPWLDPDCPEPLRRLITKCWHQDPHVSATGGQLGLQKHTVQGRACVLIKPMSLSRAPLHRCPCCRCGPAARK